MAPIITVAPFAFASLKALEPAWQLPVVIPIPTISPGWTVPGLNLSRASSTTVGSPTRSRGVAWAITKSHLGVIMLYPLVEFAGFTSMTRAIFHLLNLLALVQSDGFDLR